MTFHEIPNGLYCHDISKNKNISNAFTNYTFLNTVAANKAKCTTHEAVGAYTARNFNKEISYLHPYRYTQLLDANYFRKYPITSEDAKRSYDIYGYDTYYLQGKTTHQTLSTILNFTYITLPQTIKDHHQDVTLYANFFVVQGIPFLHNISRKTIFRTLGEVRTRTKTTMIKGLQRTIDMYMSLEWLIKIRQQLREIPIR